MDTEQLTREGLAAIEKAATTGELEEVRISLVGRRAPLTLALRELGSLPPEERGPRGKTLNAARAALERALDDRQRTLHDAELERRLVEDRIDVTLPGAAVRRGHAHLIEQT